MKPVALAVLGTTLGTTLGMILPSLPAAAQPRTPTVRLTCAEAMALVKAEGSVILGIGGRAPERFVRDRSQCELTEIAELRFVPTRDNPQCPIGYRCREPDYGDWNWNAD
ncbi:MULTISPECIES: hypothetical protein [Methylorubrum]|uniref:Uncharacterized protein n=1 Tax=Methylorubrum suomiense TaxID=144191 RepID=A0ABQ4UZ21_9HYPH|nr:MULTISPECIES: hypothetical protein [Methylobacteriaceae]GJE77080.1 hypothetical protein BGCPKDLD_3680 [Methylorubrum suomiense]